MKNLVLNSMISRFYFYFLLLISINSCKKDSQNKQSIVQSHYASFDWFDYKGKDDIYNTFTKSENEYVNPILAGFYPDPSICKAGDSYYLITSSFSYFPGIPIFKSNDLVNWKQIGHIITRNEQADFSELGVSRGMFAPTIRYHNGTFYVICTNVDQGGNFIVTAKNPSGEWSNPIWLPEINGIDPDIFFDDDGKVYITHNGPPPNDITMHNGHRAIYIWEYDLEHQKIVSDQKLLINGGTDMAKKPVWIEAPHVFKKDGFYYLICAEGGTGYEHSEVVFRSKNIYGPYVSYKNNPILTQRHLSKERPNQISTTGHADFVETQNGEWWAVYLGCRPYEIDYYNTGRETFMLPVTWQDDWPTFEKGNIPHPFVHKKPNLPKAVEKTEPMSGNFTAHDDFLTDTLDLKWNFLRNPNEDFYSISDGKIHIKPRTENIHELTNFSFIGRRQQHLTFEASTVMTYKLNNSSEAVGLVVFQNEKHYLFIGKRMNLEGNIEVFVEKVSSKLNNAKPQILAKEEIKLDDGHLFLKIEGKVRYFDFYYKIKEKEDWELLAKNVDSKHLSTKEAEGFVGSYIAMYGSLQHFK